MLRKQIKNTHQEPWLNEIISGRKKYEGRVNKGDWLNLKLNDNIIFYDDKGNEVKVKVINLKYFQNFTLAYEYLGKNLIPLYNINRNNVEKLYLNYYTSEEIKEYGVVVFEMELVK